MLEKKKRKKTKKNFKVINNNKLNMITKILKQFTIK